MRSLQDLSAFKVSASLWHRRIALKIEKLPNRCFIVDKIRDDLLKLALTESARDKVFEFIDPIGGEIYLWALQHIHFNKILSNESISNEFVWSIDGTIDKAKTAELILEKKTENVSSRYQLACLYCLEDQIQILWEQLDENEKSDMLKSQLDLVSFWSHITAKKDMEEFIREHCPGWHNTPNRFAFGAAVDTNNDVAIKYFYKKLNPNETKKAMKDVIRHSGSITDGYYAFYSDMWHGFIFAYSQLKESEVSAFSVLISYLYWPYTSQFMDFVRAMCPLLGQDEFDVVLKVMTSEYYTCNYLFEDFWNSSPVTLRQGIKYEMLDERNLNLVFKNKTRGKRWIILQVMSFPLSEDYLELFKFVLSCCCSTKDDLIEIKEAAIKAFRHKFGENNIAELGSYFNEHKSE